ncbi:MAG: tRNA uracil 4-sulfurtransferase ThiI [Bradymonadaceae bacterium]
MIASDPTTYLLRLSGTVSTKSPTTRKRFVRRLETNLRDALDRRGVDYELDRQWNRLFIHTPDPRAPELLANVCGIQSVRPSHDADYESLDDLVRVGTELFADRIDGRTFGVKARRVGQRDQFSFDSMDVHEALGGALDEAGGTVDLDDPEVRVRLEVHGDRVYFYDRDIPGPGGLPIGTQSRALALVSGGFDSAVAAWLMLKRGIALDFVFFNLGGPAHLQGVHSVIGHLEQTWIHGHRADLHIVDFRPLLAELKADVAGKYWQVVLKRLMFRAADQIADQEDYPALVSGEAIGQVSSQTLGNLAAIQAPIRTPLFRPLAGYNKEDIIALAREIDVHDRAEQVPEFCALQGGKPVTNTNPTRLDNQEANLDLSLIETLVDDRRIEELRELTTEETDLDVQIDHLPSEAALLDVRSEAKYEDWHADDAMHVPFVTALEQYPMLPDQPTWVLYCEVGLKSALIAEKMRQAGFQAYSFDGGVPKLKRWLERQHR